MIEQSLKEQLVARILRLMKRHKISQSELARRMKTSRAVVYRLLQPDDTSITLKTIGNVCRALEISSVSLVVR